MIKNLEELKKYNIICTNTDEIEKCLDILEKLGFKTEKELYSNKRIITNCDNTFFPDYIVKTEYEDINFYNFKKQTKKFLKEKEEKEKEELPDFEVSSDGRIIKVNNFKSDKKVYIIDIDNIKSVEIGHIFEYKPDFLNDYCRYGTIFSTAEAIEEMMIKQEICIKLKNIAERLNNKEKFDWDDTIQKKYYLYYDYKEKKLSQGFNSFSQKFNIIYCLDENFLEIAKEEIGENNLLKLFEA